MTDREKLIELLNHLPEYLMGAHGLADYLIDSGVTFAKDTNVPSWIPVTERLPEERDSFFARFYGTERWMPSMFRKVSDEVVVCIKYEDGSTSVKTMTTHDGEWDISSIWKAEVTHWMPLPEAPKEVE